MEHRRGEPSVVGVCAVQAVAVLGTCVAGLELSCGGPPGVPSVDPHNLIPVILEDLGRAEVSAVT